MVQFGKEIHTVFSGTFCVLYSILVLPLPKMLKKSKTTALKEPCGFVSSRQGMEHRRLGSPGLWAWGCPHYGRHLLEHLFPQSAWQRWLSDASQR